MTKKKSMRIITVVIAIMMVFSFGLAGCESDSGNGNAGTDNAAPAGGTGVEGGKDVYKDATKIAYIPISTAGITNRMVEAGLRDQIAFYSDIITIDFFDAQYDPGNQVTMLNNAITEGYDAVIIEAMDGEALKTPCEDAEKAGIPVITQNLNINAVHSLHCTGNDYNTGKEAAKVISDKLGDKGDVVTLNGPAALQSTVFYIPGFTDWMKENDSKMVHLEDRPIENWSTENADTAMRDLLTKYDNIDAVFAASDDLASGAVQAIQANAPDKGILVYGAGGFPAALTAIRDGTMFGTAFYDYYLQAATIMYQTLYIVQTGITAPTMGYANTPLLDIPSTVVTKDNVEDIADISRWRLHSDSFK